MTPLLNGCRLKVESIYRPGNWTFEYTNVCPKVVSKNLGKFGFEDTQPNEMIELPSGQLLLLPTSTQLIALEW